MKKPILAVLTLALITMSACNQTKKNPFLETYNTPFEVPPFDKIKIQHYKPAFEEGIKQQKAEIESIINNNATPTFDNTIWVYDKSGKVLSKVSNVFFNLLECDADSSMQQLAREILPLISAHGDDIAMNPQLFTKIKYVYQHRNEMSLDDQQIRVVEKYYTDFVRRGANLSTEQQQQMRDINLKLSTLNYEFGENLLTENANYKLIIDKSEDLSGLPQASIDAAAKLAQNEGMEGKWIFTLSKPSLIPFLQYAQNHELRKKIYTGYLMRANLGNEFDNNHNVEQIVQLRQQKANLLGYKDYASYILSENMAQNTQTVDTFLNQLMTPALKVAKAELAEMQAIADKEGNNVKLEACDWWYYAEKLRKEKYQFDENEIKPYLSLDNVRTGMFLAANKLYGISFNKRTDLPVYHEGVDTYEVNEADGSNLGILYLDYFPRSSKSGGAWCTAFRESGCDENGKKENALVSLVLNFTPGVGDAPALLNWDETETLWHEFGHSLHSFFSKGKYSRTCGNVPRDYVELPSQIMENWAGEPAVLRMYAKHWQTGEVIPDSLINKLENSGLFNQGFETVEFLAAAILDMKYHELTETENLNAQEFEKQEMNKIGLLPEIAPRYRSTYYSHIFNGGYAAGYYVYYWAAVLDSDAFNYFKQSGDLFNPTLAASFRTNCLQDCGNDDAMKQYIKFRGQEPSNSSFLQKHGLN